MRYIERIILLFVSERRTELKLPKSLSALAIFTCFKGQTTLKVKALLGKHHVRVLIVPANCTHKLQPLDISINKPFKEAMKKQFQLWYASEVRELLKESKLVTVDVSAAAIKHRSANWIMSTRKEIQGRPDRDGIQMGGSWHEYLSRRLCSLLPSPVPRSGSIASTDPPVFGVGGAVATPRCFSSPSFSGESGSVT